MKKMLPALMILFGVTVYAQVENAVILNTFYITLEKQTVPTNIIATLGAPNKNDSNETPLKSFAITTTKSATPFNVTTTISIESDGNEEDSSNTLDTFSLTLEKSSIPLNTKAVDVVIHKKQ
ncbi:hypothetical protein ATE92_1530 [Ulvibacter sp. MAR_2010_11]|uniref:hypothetical protein n=1 Tax=Ulvibacter sp. MAR_2010_11 TaxID=1250229 RepID=UPI000C2C51F4|nr:hypothetical protein [Ulvibacter sp. MAR_2010_11]PKA83378.1 hypothetical protein ATE92_1530 [Ulvibacter sp. MAR_2010_11]